MQSGIEYPQLKLNNAWEKVLLNQFHDVIPGSSIKEVYQDSDKMYSEVLGFVNDEIKARLLTMAKGLDTKKGALVYNANTDEKTKLCKNRIILKKKLTAMPFIACCELFNLR